MSYDDDDEDTDKRKETKTLKLDVARSERKKNKLH